MPRLVTPKVFLVGFTAASHLGITDYLRYTNQQEFEKDIDEAEKNGIHPGLVLTSLFAKLCYKSLVEGKNTNVRKLRSIENNLKATFDAAHGSVFEHVNLNFIVTDCSRIFTHELVRHRVGTAFSQTSGRYCRIENIGLVWDPILDPVKDLFLACAEDIENTVYLAECKLGLRKTPEGNVCSEHTWFNTQDEKDRWIPDDTFDFDKRKKITSAIRRIAPNGQENEIAFSVNIRALRHLVQVRTAAAAEWEIRNIFNQVYGLVKAKFPLMFHGAKERIVEDLIEVYGMRLQPYERKEE